jgi:uncharacterized protein (TIGR02271 family)
MITSEQVDALYDSEVYDRDGDKIGKVGQIWDDGSGQPAWASVKTGLFGLNESLVPLQDADVQSDRVVVPFEKAKVKDAPNVDASHDEPLTQDDVQKLYEYYGVNWQDSRRAYQAGAAAGNANYTGTDATASGASTTYADSTSYADTTGAGADYADPSLETSRSASRDSSQASFSGADDGMTRSEERLNVDKEREQIGRARLRKYIVTENQQVNVPVEREQVRLEREPITDANRDAAFSGPDLTESEHEVTLHAERPVVNTETVPVERVHLGKQTVTDEQTVGGDVRKERIEADLPDDQGRRSFE